MVDDRTFFTNSEAIERLWEISQPASREPPPLQGLRARLNRALGDGRSDRTARLARPARSHLTSDYFDVGLSPTTAALLAEAGAVLAQNALLEAGLSDRVAVAVQSQCPRGFADRRAVAAGAQEDVALEADACVRGFSQARLSSVSVPTSVGEAEAGPGALPATISRLSAAIPMPSGRRWISCRPTLPERPRDPRGGRDEWSVLRRCPSIAAPKVEKTGSSGCRDGPSVAPVKHPGLFTGPWRRSAGPRWRRPAVRLRTLRAAARRPRARPAAR